jgi:predicted  nucleic acid-binding Zn-ribbon protein
VDSKQQTVSLVKIQHLATERREAKAYVESAPARIEEIENRFRERNAEYVAVKDRYDELDTDQRTRNGELTTLEESRKKYMDDLMQVQNQREYSAMLKEIDIVKARISEHEDAILKDMEELETLKVDLEKHAEHIQEERKLVEKELAEVRARVEESEERIRVCTAERERLESGLPETLVLNIQRVEEMRRGIFLARAEDGTCQSCYVRVRPQVYQEIRQATAIHSCGNCRRFLYYPPTVEADLAGESGSEEQAPGVEVVNGGAV